VNQLLGGFEYVLSDLYIVFCFAFLHPWDDEPARNQRKNDDYSTTAMASASRLAGAI